MTTADYPDAPQGADTRQEGEKFQEFIRQLLNPWGLTMFHFSDKWSQYNIGENPQGCEVKLDKRCTDTQRLSIEIREKTRASNQQWRESGILRADNSWLYVQGNYHIVFVFAKTWLQLYYEKKITSSDIKESHGTVQKFYIPLHVAMKGAALVLDGNGNRLRQLPMDQDGQSLSPVELAQQAIDRGIVMEFVTGQWPAAPRRDDINDGFVEINRGKYSLLESTHVVASKGAGDGNNT